MEKFKVFIKTSAVKDLAAVDLKKDRQRIASQIRTLADNPRPAGCEKLSGGRDEYRVRQGRYRILYYVDDEKCSVHVVKVAHRRESYR